ncbi:MAG TPA: FAD-dependent oxidoreductase [Phycisphaerae bacterium]|nr:FAD-dependent oxidoreductase [Phycisphaerae bacterium]
MTKNDPACEYGPVLTDTQARMEASRCLMCEDPPCVAACPAGVPVKHFIRAIRFDSPRRAINLIRDRNVLAGVCGLACPVDSLCVGACTSTELSTPIAIGKLQHYAAVQELRSGRQTSVEPANGQKVAIIGAGPSGLAAAAELARLGHRPVVFEKSRSAGGICAYGVHSRRVPRALVSGEIDYIKSLGVDIQTESPFSDGQSLDDLFADGFKAAYVSTGLQEPATPRIPGENLKGVTTWKAMLERFAAWELGEGKKPVVPREVIIVGGGSVAMDAASAVKSLGAKEIDMVCLEAPVEMPAYHAELDEAWEEGVRFHTRSMPLKITGKDGKVTGLKAVRIRWKKPKQFIPSNAVKLKGTEYWLPASMVIFAIGARASQVLKKSLRGVRLDKAGKIAVKKETGATSRPGVFAGGDVVAGGGTMIVKAVAEGKRAGQAIDEYLRK